ncbi:MAG: TetR/AcrR family transcriptional regulator [Pseudomonadota bacterium]
MPTDRWLSDLHWRRESQQSRGEKTQAALMDSAEALIVEKGTEATSIADIARRAGCSVGAVYHHFRDKDALYFALFHRWTQTLSDLNRQAANPDLWEGASVRDLLTGYVDFKQRVRQEGAAAKAAAALVMADNPELRQHIAEITREGHKTLQELILARRSEISHPDPEWAVAFVIDQLGAMLNARVDPGQQIAAISQTDDDMFKREALNIATTFLGLKR